jgi:hypothetical protein
VAYVHPTNPSPNRRIVALVRDSARTNPATERTIQLLTELGGRLGEVHAFGHPRA